jgi:hypothetical protein
MPCLIPPWTEQFHREQECADSLHPGAWPLFVRTRTLNVAAYCAPVSSIPAGQQKNVQVAGARDTFLRIRCCPPEASHVRARTGGNCGHQLQRHLPVRLTGTGREPRGR